MDKDNFTMHFSEFGPSRIAVDVTASYEVVESEDGGNVPNGIDVIKMSATGEALSPEREEALIVEFSQDPDAMAALYSGISDQLQGPR